MTPVIPCSVSNVPLIPGTAFSTRRNNSLTILSLSRNYVKYQSVRRFLLPPCASIGPFPPNKRAFSFHRKSGTPISATGADVVVEEPDSPVINDDPAEASETPSDEVATSEDSSSKSASPAKARRSRPARKSDMPPVKNEDLIIGATFTGKVKSIQPFGAFVDFGAFTDGLVHVSRLSDSYVKDVGSVVSVGQEVKVKLIEVNTETQRISLSMRENDDTSKLQQQKDASISTEKAGPGRRNTSKPSSKRDDMKKSTKFVKGQDLEGTVKNITRSGAFISLPDGEEGFLPISEEPDDGFGNVMGTTSLQVDQDVKVRVLRITRGSVTLTMKKEEDTAALDSEITQGVVHTATNPFFLAFRKNKEIAAFLDEREKTKTDVEKPSIARVSEDAKGTVTEEEIGLDVADTQDETETDATASNIKSDDIEESKKTDVTESNLKVESPLEIADKNVIESRVDDDVVEDEKQIQTSNVEEESAAEAPTDNGGSEPSPDNNGSITGSDVRSSVLAPQETEERTESDDQVVLPEGRDTEINNTDEVPALTAGDEISSASQDDRVGAVPENSDSETSSSSQIGVLSSEGSLNTDGTGDNDQVVSSEGHSGELVSSSIDSLTEEEPNQSLATKSETSLTSQVEDKEVEITSEKNSSLSNANGQSEITASDQGSSQATISPALVKQLREETGAGMMDCKKALAETGGDIVKAQEFLRKKGLASADKKASRVTAEGRIGSYIHDSRIGVLVEVNCETDFVSRGEIFKELVDDVAMQVAACPQVEYLVTEDVPEEIVNKEKDIEMQKEDLLSKPEQIRSKIVEGRIRKRLEELALLEQPYIKNDKVAVKDLIKQTIATIGENIKVKRFVRFNLGEGLEKKSQDFAAEVAAQTAAKPVATPVKEEPAIAGSKETEEKPTITVSAALVKRLREETGAGMMDCKKALAETGGDLEKAQEYLRKKGLSSAEKKSSRLAAEGRIGSYIHDSRIGVLIEVNCETDFVGRSEKFKDLVDDLAMQVVACPQVQFVSIEDIPESIVQKEKELEMQREDLLSKPENIREKIVEGRVSKRFGELALLEQPFIKDDSVLVKDLVKQTVAAIGENIKVRRFVRFTLGETPEAKTETETTPAV
ncbi:hypothetical protein L6164_007944 [Bauhinia variegata]|uniref:Uncharacterized protein n=1 Tax=Bauhinia variegata TaxID=167791 RepID=A0ACB9PEA7_BAUVA|nr:hypothetical protein L6164_007944 [Bauhinia variegata]